MGGKGSTYVVSFCDGHSTLFGHCSQILISLNGEAFRGFGLLGSKAGGVRSPGHCLMGWLTLNLDMNEAIGREFPTVGFQAKNERSALVGGDRVYSQRPV